MFGKKQQQPGGGPERFREENIGKKIAGGISIAVIAIFALILLGGSFYSLKENEYAVITTFGVPKVVEESGIPSMDLRSDMIQTPVNTLTGNRS